MDDGSDSVDTSRDLLEALKSQGVNTVCSTSHFYRRQNDVDRFLERRAEAIKNLPQVDGMTVLFGAEVAFFPEMSECDDLDKLCITGTKVLLVEMPFTKWTSSQLEEVNRLVLDKDYKVVLAHPERFLFDNGNKQKIEKLCDMGVGLQVNAETFLSWRTRKKALMLLEATDYPYLGTDCHNMKKRPPRMDEARKVIERKLGAEFLSKIDECMNETLFGGNK